MHKFVLLLLVSGLCFSFGCAANPITGEDELMLDRDYHHDIKLGKDIAPKVEKALKGRIKDQVLQDYINGVGHKIARFSHNPDFDFNFVAGPYRCFRGPGGCHSRRKCGYDKS